MVRELLPGCFGSRVDGCTAFIYHYNFDFSREVALAGEPAALMSHLDLLLCHGSMSDESYSPFCFR